MLKLEPIFYLYLVNNFNSIKRAAEVIHITPSAISKAIHKWQAEIGLPLVNQTYHGIELTPLAKEIVKRAETIIKEIYFIEELIESHGSIVEKEESQSFILYTAESFYQTDLENIWNYFDSFGIKVNVADVTMDYRKCLEYVNENPNNFFINFLVDHSEENSKSFPNVEYIKIIEEKPFVRYSEKISLKHKMDNYILPEELVKYKIIVYNKGFGFVLPICEKLEELEGKLNIVYTSSVTALYAMVAKGEGCSISTESMPVFLNNIKNDVVLKHLSKLPIKMDVNIALYLCFNKNLDKRTKNIFEKIAMDIVKIV